MPSLPRTTDPHDTMHTVARLAAIATVALAHVACALAAVPPAPAQRFGVLAQLAGSCWIGGDRRSADLICVDLDPAGTHIDIRTFRDGRLDSVSRIVEERAGASLSASTAAVGPPSPAIERRVISLDAKGADARWSQATGNHFRSTNDCWSTWRVVLSMQTPDRFSLTRYDRGPCDPERSVASVFDRVSPLPPTQGSATRSD